MRNTSIPSCKTCLFVRNGIFKSLPREELENLTYEKGCNFLRRGNVIYQENNRLNGFYCVSKGVVKIYKTGLEGKEQIIRFAKAGNIFGYRSVLSGELACSSAKVIEDSVVCFIPATTLFRLLKKHPQFGIDMLQLTCRELDDANTQILEIAQKTVRERLAEVLLLLKDTFGLTEEGFLNIQLTREEIANMVGTATESVIRLLSEFKQDKLIELSGKKIKLANIQKLMRIGNIYV